jgi:hypothetical protein
VLGPGDYIVWCLSFPLEAGVVVFSVRGASFFRYFALNLFMLGTLAISIGRLAAYLHYGFSSSEYLYVYYYSEALGIILLYFSVINLFLCVFQEMRARAFVRALAIGVLLVTAFFSYLVVRQSANHLSDRFVLELIQNLYFVGLLITYVLWGTIAKLRETRVRIILFALSLGIFFSAHAATYALRSFFPALNVWKLIPPLLGLWLPLSWLYTFALVREDSQIVPVRSFAYGGETRVAGAGAAPRQPRSHGPGESD